MTDFNEQAVREWLYGQNPEAPDYTMAFSVGAVDDWDYNWPGVVNRLVEEAIHAELLPIGTLVWLVADADGIVDGILVTRDKSLHVMANPPREYRLCSTFIDAKTLVRSDLTGVDLAIDVLGLIHDTAERLIL